MAEDRQVAIPNIDTLPLNPHLLRALFSHFENVMNKSLEEDTDNLEGTESDVIKAMVHEESPALFSDMFKHMVQSKSFLQDCLVQQRLLQRLEITVKQDLYSKGIVTVTLAQLEAEKYKLLAKLIQAGNDKDALEVLQYYTELMHKLFDIPISDKEIQEILKQKLASVSESYFSSPAFKIIKDTEQYYFEELSITAQASSFEVISYDPLFSSPKGK